MKELQEINGKGYYSQTYEDKVLERIFQKIGWTNKIGVELGAGDGVNLSNCNYLIQRYGLKTLRIDGEKHEGIKQAWITQDNILDLMKKIPVNFDLLSIDLDGNDFWILRMILQFFIPRVVILEVNGTLDPEQSIIMPYNPNHVWDNDNYYGASFKAYVKLMEKFNYILVRNIEDLNLVFVIKNEVKEPVEIEGTQRIYHKIKQNAEWLHFQ